MNHPRLPRALIVLLFILVAGTFLVGALRSFASAQAAPVLEDTSQNGRLSGEALAPTLTSSVNFLTPGPTFTALPASLLPPATPVETVMPTPAPTLTLPPTDTPVPEQEYYTDMTGIVSLGILLVVVILVGITWGGFSMRGKKERK
ncbi:MAG: hypothetical protein ABSG01_07105 [Anaerolineales bacterium]|jgi:hypothetical protein